MATWVSLFDKATKSVQAATDAAPTIITDGIPILGMTSVGLTIECDVGQTILAAAGVLDLYLWDDLVGAWSYVMYQGIQIPQEVVGRRRFTTAISIANARGRMAYICNGLSLSGGGITQYYLPTFAWFPSRIT